jgi:hypothetical protein
MDMDEQEHQQANNDNDTLTWEKVVSGALKQAARHEHALQACLAELGGYDAPTSDLSDSTRRRATRHADRAIGLVRTAIRLNRDPLAEAFLAALQERHERNAMLIERVDSASELATLSIAG